MIRGPKPAVLKTIAGTRQSPFEDRWGEISIMLEIGKVHRAALTAKPPQRSEMLAVLEDGYSSAPEVVPWMRGTVAELNCRRWRQRLAVAIGEIRAGIASEDAIGLYDSLLGHEIC